MAFVEITLLNFSRQQFSRSVMVLFITASVNRDVVCTRMADTLNTRLNKCLYYKIIVATLQTFCLTVFGVIGY